MRIIHSSLGASASSLLAALTALCCIVPLGLASAGALGSVAYTWAGIATELSPYRPYMLGVSVVLLSFGFSRFYFAKGAGSCSIRAGRVTRLSLWIAAGVTMIAAALPHFLFRYVVL